MLHAHNVLHGEYLQIGRGHILPDLARTELLGIMVESGSDPHSLNPGPLHPEPSRSKV